VRASGQMQATLREAHASVERMARVSEIISVTEALSGAGVRSAAGFDVQVVYERQIDVAAETERLQKDLTKLEKEYAGAEAKLGNANFIGKASPSVIDGVRRRALELVELIRKLRDGLDGLASK
jgi:valyl-tRNA synthetase